MPSDPLSGPASTDQPRRRTRVVVVLVLLALLGVLLAVLFVSGVLTGGAGAGSQFEATLGPEELFTVDLTFDEATSITIDVRGDDELDPVARLVQGEVEIAENDDRGVDGAARAGGDPFDPLIETDVQPGDYTLEVRPYGITSGSFVATVD